MIIDLRKINLRDLPLGTEVITSKGFRWSLVSREKSKETWQDLTSGFIWYPKEEDTYTHYAAIEKFGNKIPTIEEFMTAETHGIREVVPDIDHWFWSSSLDPCNEGAAQGFSGSIGRCLYDYIVDVGSVRLVRREK